MLPSAPGVAGRASHKSIISAATSDTRVGYSYIRMGVCIQTLFLLFGIHALGTKLQCGANLIAAEHEAPDKGGKSVHVLLNPGFFRGRSRSVIEHRKRQAHIGTFTVSLFDGKNGDFVCTGLLHVAAQGNLWLGT